MLLEGCQGKKGVQIREKTCPNCGSSVELMSTDVCAQCEECGTVVYSDLMDCVQHCPKARECVGDAYYERLIAAKEQWQARMQALQDDDEW